MEESSKETEISRAIISQYHENLLNSLENDVVIVGAGPSGLTAAYYLAKAGAKTLVLEKRLSIGGGIWGGASGMNVIAVEDTEILDELGVRTSKYGNLYTADSIELAITLGYKAKKAGANILNLMEAEDLIVKNNEVKGVVVNSTAIRQANLHVDPYCIQGKYIVDATGHAAELAYMLKKRLESGNLKVADISLKEIGEGFMDVEEAEKKVVEKTLHLQGNLYLTGMAVCAVHNLPRMGPIFGGMLKSGKKIAEILEEKLVEGK